MDADRLTHGPGGATAAVNMEPFTRVAVCVGRVFSAKEHRAVFRGPIGDPWEQWTFVREGSKARQGYVVTPGMPGGALDPEFADLSASPHFREVPRPDQEPECVYVLNYPKGRMEYWVGRRGARAGQHLRLCFRVEASAFPVVYILYGNVARPRSANELARSPAGQRILEKCGGWTRSQHRALLQHWADTYHPSMEAADPSMFFKTTNVDQSRNIRNRASANRYWSTRRSKRELTRFSAPLVARRAINRMETAYIARRVQQACDKLRTGTYRPSSAQVANDLDLFARHYISKNDRSTARLDARHHMYPLQLLKLVYHAARGAKSNNLSKHWDENAMNTLKGFYDMNASNDNRTASSFLNSLPGILNNPTNSRRYSRVAQAAMKNVCTYRMS